MPFIISLLLLFLSSAVNNNHLSLAGGTLQHRYMKVALNTADLPSKSTFVHTQVTATMSIYCTDETNVVYSSRSLDRRIVPFNSFFQYIIIRSGKSNCVYANSMWLGSRFYILY